MTGSNKKMNFPKKKEIKLSGDQFEKWDSDTPKQIRAFLDGNPQTTDLKTILKVYNMLFTKIVRNFKIFEFIQKTDPDIIEYIENHEEFSKAVELVK